MKLSKFTVIVVVLLMAILAIGAVSAESIDDADASIATGDGDLGLQLSDDSAADLGAVDTISDVASTDNDENIGSAVLTDGDDGDDEIPDDPDDSDEKEKIEISEDTYSTYFNEDGTPTATLSAEGNYELQIASLTGKNIIINSGSNIAITYFGESYFDEELDEETHTGGIIKNGTITLGGDVQSVLISGLIFNNTNKDAIVINGCNDISISDNTIFVNTDSSATSVNAILLNGAVSEIEIGYNSIFIEGSASYNYGIDLMCYGAMTNPQDITISNNRIEMNGDGQTGIMEAIYLSDPVDLLVEDNDVVVNTVNDVYAYGIQVADDVQYVYMYEGYTGSITSPCNILIQGNRFLVSSEFMTYAVSVLDYGVDGYDEYYQEEWEMAFPTYNAFDTNIVISDNNVIAKSTKGVMGIAGQTYNMTVEDNDLIVLGGVAEEKSNDALGNGSYALCVQYFAMDENCDYTIVVKDNSVLTNVTKEYINNDDYSELVTFENNNAPTAYTINDNTYSIFFNEDGTTTDFLSPMGDYTLVIDYLNGKDIIISSGSNINITGLLYDDEGGEYYGYIDGSITIGDGAGSAAAIRISNLEINTMNGAGIDIKDYTNDVTIDNCRFSIIGNTEGIDDPFSVYAINAIGYISDLTITNNGIRVHGDAAYSYGINLGSYGAEANPENIYIANNDISVIVGESMAEAIYLDNPVNAVVEFNNVTVINEGDNCAYGIQISDSAQWTYYYAGYEGTLTSAKDILINDNNFNIASDFMVYGITVLDFGVSGYDPSATYYSMPLCYQFDLNTTIVNNTVVANSKRGVIGIGGQTYNMTVINNDVTAIGTSAEEMTTGDALGNHTSALCVEYNTGSTATGYHVIVKDNKVTTNVLAEELNSEMYRTYVTFENNTASPVIVIDDDTYSTYFNDDGTPKDTLPEDGGYALYIDQIHNKDIQILSGSEITIAALNDFRDIEDEDDIGNIINGTIYIGASDVTVKELRIVNENKIGIDIADGSNEITISDNTIEISSVAIEGDEYFSAYAINANGYIYGLYIMDNDIRVRGSAPYNYGIQLGSYGADSNPDDIQILNNNINMNVQGENAIMAEPIYLDNVINALVDGNEIRVYTEGNVFAYGIQVADSAQYVFYRAGYEGSLTSPANVTITNNELELDSEYMIYGITFQSFGADGYDPDMDPYSMPLCYQFELNTTIANNTINAHSDRGVIGIGALAYNVTIEENTLYVYGTTAEGIESADAFKNDTYALGVNYNAGMAEDDYYCVVQNNFVRTDVTGEHINADEYLDYVTFENNTIIKVKDGSIVIDDSNYAYFFDEEGNINEDIPVSMLSDVLLGNLTNKKLIIDCPISIGALDEECKLINTTISLVDGADGSVIDGLTIIFDNNTESTGIIYITDVEDVRITGNTIIASDCQKMMMAIEVESGEDGCSDIVISGNTIAVAGDTNYLYGIDVFQTWGSSAKNFDIGITDNVVTVLGGAKMAEPIYVSGAENVGISGNTLTAISNGCAYGIATDSLNNAAIQENTINIEAATNGMAYAITSTNSNDIEILDNNITAEGTGVVGIGLKDDNIVSIEGNTINVTGGYYETAQSRDSLGLANAAILNKDDSSTEVTIGENEITENFPVPVVLIDESNYEQYFDDEGNIIDGTIPENSNVVFGDLIGKNMVIAIPLNISAAENTKLKNCTIKVVEGADGTNIEGLTIEFDNNTASTGIIYLKDVSNVNVTKNIIIAADCAATMMPIEIESGNIGCNDILVSENIIAVAGTAKYLYGVDVFKSGTGATNIGISDNEITILGSTTMAEPIYVSGASNVGITGNNLTVVSNGRAYGIATDNLNNVQISDNNINVDADTTGMAYAITSLTSTDVDITDNNITVEGTGAIGIALKGDDIVNIDGNSIEVTGGDFTTAVAQSSIGKANAAIFNKDSSSTGVTIGDNTLVVNGPKLLDDSTYGQFFYYENGTVRDDAPIAIGDTLLVGTLTNKNMIIDVPVNLKGMDANNLVNTTISLVSGADGSNITDLNMEFTGDETSGSFAVISAFEVSHIVIANNTIDIPDSKGWGYAMAIEVEGLVDGCDDVTISGNKIDFKGSTAGMYGIDVFTDYYAPTAQNTNIVITDNIVNTEGATGMAEPIYINKVNGLLVANNTLSSKGGEGADAYGIGASSTNDAVFADNNITANGTNMAYGISSTYSNNVTIENNNITAEGTGAVGVGLAGDSDVKVENNEIAIVGGDFTNIFTWDSVGTANAAILDKDGTNANVNVGENAMTENGKATERVMTGNGTKDLQNILNDAEAGSTVDLTGQYFKDVGTVVLDKDIAITGGKIIGKEGKAIFEIAPKSENGPSEVNITGVNILVNNANVIVKVTGENATDGTSIEVPAINIKDNNIEAANDDVVTESVTVLELDSERPVLSPTNDITISGNTIAAGVDPFDFKVTSISSGGDTIITPQNITTEKKATQIIYKDMVTTAVDMGLDGRVGEWFNFTLVDGEGNPIPNMPMEIGFNGKIYNYENDGIITNENGTAQLQINLGSAGSNTFGISFLGNDEYNASFAVARINVTAQKGSMTVPNKSYSASAKTKTLTATLKSASGKAVRNKEIIFLVNGYYYSAKTNAKGVATVKVSLNKKGTYKFSVIFDHDVRYAPITKKATLTIK